MTQADLFGDAPPAAARPHTLLLASAGTGKTYRLSGHFAALLLSGIAPERILATTFTRKAAGEILDRVLQRVRVAASPDGAEQRSKLHDEIQRLTPGAPALTVEHCEGVLAQLVRRLDRFQVRTIDAFFVRLATLFASELELPHEWRITDELEARAVQREIVARVLDSLELEERVVLLRGMVSGGAQRGAEAALVREIAKAEEIGREADEGAWHRIEPLPRPTDDELEAAARVVLAAELPVTKKGTPVKNWENAIGRLRELLEPLDGGARLDMSILGSGIVPKALEGSTFSSKPIPDDLHAALRTLALRVLASEVEDLRSRNVAVASFLRQYLGADADYRREVGAYRFEDFSRLLLEGPLQLAHDEWLVELAYRLDGRVDHLLLDEFQDTGTGQWRLLEPLAAELLAGGQERSFFCVGDTKQSIYGWRGGEPRLLSGMAARYPSLDPEPLATNWRSSSVVLDAVNVVFDDIVERDCLRGDAREVARRATEAWSSGFEPHVAADPELGGEARLWRARPNVGDEKPLDPALLLAVERVVHHHAAQPDARIAVLLRAGSQIARLRFLLSRAGIDSSDEGGNPLTDSAGVTWVLALLQLADHPDDGVARLQVARSPLAGEYGLALDDVERANGARAGRRASARVREALLRRGYGEVVRDAVRGLGEALSDWDVRRLEQLVDMAYAHDERATLRPIDFVDLVRETKVPDPTDSRVRVMTIHRSKGLEFDVVVLPELGKSIQLTPAEYLPGRDDVTAPPHVATARPQKWLVTVHEQLAELHGEAQERAMTDALSVLYVGMTRAVHALELIVPTPSKKSSKSEPDALRSSSLVEPALAEAGIGGREGDPEGETETARAALVWEHADSTSDWRAAAPQDVAAFVPERPLELRPDGPDPEGTVLRPSGVQERRPSTAAGLVAPREAAGYLLGAAVHALFESVRWIEDDARTDAELRADCVRRAPADAPVDDALAVFRRAVESPVARELLARPVGDAEVMTERLFDVEVSDEDTAALRVRGAVDRVVLRREGDAVVSAHVVDFKTDADGDPAALLAAHGDQLRAYRGAVSALFDLDGASVRATILWVSASEDARAVDVD